MDASNFLDIKYASFTGLGWFNYQLKKGGICLFRRINNNNKRVILLELVCTRDN